MEKKGGAILLKKEMFREESLGDLRNGFGETDFLPFYESFWGFQRDFFQKVSLAGSGGAPDASACLRFAFAQEKRDAFLSKKHPDRGEEEKPQKTDARKKADGEQPQKILFVHKNNRSFGFSMRGGAVRYTKKAGSAGFCFCVWVGKGVTDCCSGIQRQRERGSPIPR